MGLTVKHLLLIGTGHQHFREYLLDPIAARYRIHLFTTSEPDWEKRYLDAATVLTTTLDPAVLIPAARRLHALDPVDGVLCWDEARVEAAAAVADALDLPGPSLAAVRRCRDKHLTRLALAAAGVAQPASVLVGSMAEALAAADRIGYPVVLKPRALAASLGVVLVHSPAELREAFAFTAETTVPGVPVAERHVLVEEFADGPEISVDCAVIGGSTYPYCVARKQLGYPPYFEEVGHRVSGDDPLLQDAGLQRLLDAAHRAVDFQDGMTHTELRLTPIGPRIVEINARIGGDLIPYLGWRATGVHPGVVAAAIACGDAPDLRPSIGRHGGIRFAYADRKLTVQRVDVRPDALISGVDRVEVLAEPGRTYAPPPEGTAFDRIGFVTAVGDSPDDCTAALHRAADAFDLR